MYLLYCFFGNVLALAEKTRNFRNKVTLSKKTLTKQGLEKFQDFSASGTL